LASSSASASVSNGRTTRTGPKISCWTISLSCAASVMSVGHRTRHPGSRRRQAGSRRLDRRALGRLRPLHEAVDTGDLGRLMSVPRSVAGSNGSPTRTASNSSAGAPNGRDAPMDVGPGRGRAILAAVDERAGGRAASGGLEVRIRVDDERGLATQLQVDTLETPAASSWIRRRSPNRRSAR
jgi:hypothetical protein